MKLDPCALDQIRALQRPGAPSLLERVIEIYLTTAPKLLATMRTAIKHGDSEAIRHAAHSLKSSSSNLGATTLAELCRTLEAEARAGGSVEPGERLETIEREFHQVRIALDSEVKHT